MSVASRRRVLVVAPSAVLRGAIARILQRAGYTVELAAGEKRARELIADGKIEAAIVAPGAINANNLAMAQELQDAIGKLIVLADRADEIDILARLLPEADGFVSQPLNGRALVGRLAQSIASKEKAPDERAAAPAILRFEGRTVDIGGRTFRDADGREVVLTRAEFALLAQFLLRPGRVLSRDHLHHAVAGGAVEPYDRGVDMLVARLRRKVEPDPKKPRFIVTVPGAGYKFAARPETVESTTTEAIETGRPARRGATPRAPDRRQLTVMACQIRGFATLSTQLDPEDLQATFRPIYQACAEVVAQARGVLAKMVGGSLLIYFGWAEAQEDDAERAVRAALELARIVSNLDIGRPIKLRPRIGIASGIVLAEGSAGPGPADEYAAAGEALNVALHLSFTAAEDGVVIAPSTYELVGRFFDVREVESVVLEDGVNPIAVWRVFGDSATTGRFEALRRTGMQDLVGREEEMELLLRRWSMVRGGAGQVVLLTGEAGIGKSRLVVELEQRIHAEPHATLYYHGSPHRANAPLFAVIDELQRAAGFEHTDAPDERLVKLKSLLARSGPCAIESLVPLAEALSLPVEGQSAYSQVTGQLRKEHTFTALLMRIEGLAAREPVLMRIEDIQWLDPTSLEFICLVAAKVPTQRVMMLVTARPEFRPSWPDHAQMRVVTLSRLNSSDAESLVKHVARGKRLPEEVMSQIVSRTDGVPLFLEELTKTVLESGIFRERAGRLELRRGPFTLNLPKTLQGSLLERLDRLGPAKSVAQVAAVIGREFNYELLRLLVSMDPPALAAALDRLTASELVFGRGLPPHAVYTFKHALVRDAAYESLLKSERRRLHAELAIILQSRASSRIHHHADVLADHYAKSGQTSEAIKHWAIAARQALQRSENVEALGYASQALDVINLLPDTPERRNHELSIKLLAGGAHWLVSGFASSEVEHTFIRARELATQVGDAARLTLALRGLAVCYYARGELIRACTTAEKIIILAQESSNSADLMWGRMMLGSILFWQGEFGRARRELEASLILYDPIDQSAKTVSSQIDPGIAARCHLGWTLWIIGCPDQAQEFSDQTVTQARRIDQPSSQAMALFWSGIVQFYRGDVAAATATTNELRAITTKFRLAYYGLRASLLEGAMMVATGQFERGLSILRQTIFELGTQKTGLALPWAYSLAAMGCLGLGMFDDALAMLQEGMIAVQAGKQCHWEAELYRLKGEVLSVLSTREAVAAEACLVQAIGLARHQGARSLELRAAVSYGRMLQRRGDYRKAQESVTQVLSAFSEGFATADIVDAKGVSAELRG